MNKKTPAGMTAFIIVWIGQIVSVLASTMSQFGLTLWMYQQTQSATAMALMQVFFVTPFLIVSPIAGVMVDRYSRKLMMMVSDLAAVIATSGIFVVDHNRQAAILASVCCRSSERDRQRFQWPAYSAAISTMIPK